MPWVKLDDSMPEHRKIRDLSDAAFRLHVSAICWCNRHLTDGRVGEKDLRHVSDVRGAKRCADILVNVGLWKPTEDGWLIHDYLEYQFSADRIRAERRAAAERQARWKEKRRRGNAVTGGVTSAVTDYAENLTDTPSDRDLAALASRSRRVRVANSTSTRQPIKPRPAEMGSSNAVSNAYPAPAPTPSPRKGRSGEREEVPSTEVIHSPSEHHFNGEDPTVCVDCGLPAANRRHALRLVEGGP